MRCGRALANAVRSRAASAGRPKPGVHARPRKQGLLRFAVALPELSGSLVDQVLAGLRPLPAKEFQILVFQFVGRHEKFSGRVVEFDEIRKPLRTLDKQVQALSFRPNTDWRHSKLGAAAPVGMIMVRRFNRTNRTEG